MFEQGEIKLENPWQTSRRLSGERRTFLFSIWPTCAENGQESFRWSRIVIARRTTGNRAKASRDEDSRTRAKCRPRGDLAASHEAASVDVNRFGACFESSSPVKFRQNKNVEASLAFRARASLHQRRFVADDHGGIGDWSRRGRNAFRLRDRLGPPLGSEQRAPVNRVLAM